MAKASLELIINGSVGAGFNEMLSRVKSGIAGLQNGAAFETAGAGVATFTGKVQKLGATLEKHRQSFLQGVGLGGGLGNLISGAAVGAGLTSSVNAAIDFEEKFAEVKKVLDGTDAEIENLRNTLKGLTRELPATHGQLAEIAAAAGQMGIAMEKIPTFVTMAAKAVTTFEGMGALEAGEIMGKLSNIYKIPIEELQARVLDPANEISNKMQVAGAEVTRLMQEIGGSAANIGLGTDGAAALSAALVAVGNSAAESGTSISTGLARLQGAAAGAAKFRKPLELMGITAEELAQMLKEPEQGLYNVFNAIRQIESGTTRTQILQGFFGLEHQAKFALLINDLEKYTDALAYAKTAAGSMEKEYAARAATTANAAIIFKNAIADFKMGIGDSLLPALNSLLHTVTPAIQVLGGFIAKNQTLTTVMLGSAAAVIFGGFAIKSFLFVLGSAALVVTKLIGLFRFLAPAIKMVGTAIAFVGRLLLLNPIGLLITGIATAAFLIYKYWEPIKKFFSGLWDTIKSVLSGLYEKMVSFGAHLIEGLIAGLKKAGGAVWNAIKGVGETVKGAFKSVLQINSPSKVFQGFGENIGQGLILGVNATKGAANRAMSELANPRLKTGGAGFAGGAAGNMRITYSPTINLAGAAENVKREVSDALKNSQVEFEKMFKRMVTQNERRALVW